LFSYLSFTYIDRYRRRDLDKDVCSKFMSDLFKTNYKKEEKVMSLAF